MLLTETTWPYISDTRHYRLIAPHALSVTCTTLIKPPIYEIVYYFGSSEMCTPTRLLPMMIRTMSAARLAAQCR